MSELLTIEETARRLRLTRQTVLKLCGAGELPGVKIGGAWRVNSARLEELLLDDGRKPDPAERL